MFQRSVVLLSLQRLRRLPAWPLPRIVSALLALAVCLSLTPGSVLGGAPPPAPLNQALLAETKFVQVGDIRMAYRIIGSGTPLVMIMGTRGTMDNWDPTFVNLLAARHQVILFDNRGMGDTTLGTAQLTIPQMAADTAGLMQALSISKAHILGWSMGSRIAQEFVLTYPTMVDKLVLYAGDPGGPGSVPNPPAVIAALTNFSGTPLQQAEAIIKVLFPQSWIDQNRVYLALLALLPKEPVSPAVVQAQVAAEEAWPGSWNRLGQITAQTLIIQGTVDALDSVTNAKILLNGITGSSLILIPGGGHGVMYQYPTNFADFILAFLAPLRTPLSPLEPTPAATATRTPVVPETTPLWLFGSGLAGLGWLVARSRRR